MRKHAFTAWYGHVNVGRDQESVTVSREFVSVSLHFAQSVETLFAFLAEHENQAQLFSVRVERLRDGTGHRDGVGSMRRIHAPPLPAFEETITVFAPNQRIEYRMSNAWNSPIRDHLGVLVFSPQGEGTLLDYTISFTPRIAVMGSMLRALTERNLRRGLEALAEGRVSRAF